MSYQDVNKIEDIPLSNGSNHKMNIEDHFQSSFDSIKAKSIAKSHSSISLNRSHLSGKSHLTGSRLSSKSSLGDLINPHSGSKYGSRNSIKKGDSFLPQLKLNSRSSKNSIHSLKIIKKKLPSGPIRLHRYVSDTEKLCFKIKSYIQEDEEKVLDLMQIIKNNHKMRNDIKMLSLSLNKVIERKQFE